MEKVHDPENETPITEVWVGLSEDANGNNGVCGMLIEGMGGMQMMTGKSSLLPLLKTQAGQMARMTDKAVKIYRFERKELVFEVKR